MKMKIKNDIKKTIISNLDANLFIFDYIKV
jgi:hypothetical protein